MELKKRMRVWVQRKDDLRYTRIACEGNRSDAAWHMKHDAMNKEWWARNIFLE